MIEKILLDKSLAFSTRVVKMARFVSKKNFEYIFSKQVLDTGLVAGVLIRQGLHARNQLEEENKLQAALEAAEATLFRIEVLEQLTFLTDKEANSIIMDCQELISLLKRKLAGESLEDLSESSAIQGSNTFQEECISFEQTETQTETQTDPQTDPQEE